MVTVANWYAYRGTALAPNTVAVLADIVSRDAEDGVVANVIARRGSR